MSDYNHLLRLDAAPEDRPYAPGPHPLVNYAVPDRPEPSEGGTQDWGGSVMDGYRASQKGILLRTHLEGGEVSQRKHEDGANIPVDGDEVDSEERRLRAENQKLREVLEQVKEWLDLYRMRARNCGHAAIHDDDQPEKYALRAALYHGVADEIQQALPEDMRKNA